MTAAMTRIAPAMGAWPRLPAWGEVPGMHRVPGLRIIRVPRDLESVTTIGREDAPADGGLTRDGVERMWAAVTSLYRSGVHPGLQMCVRRHGAVVLNRSIGHASGNGPGRDPSPLRAMTPDTPVFTSSASKGVTAFVVLMLHERGLLDIFEPAASYVPEFGAHGKDAITIAHLLAHRSGLPELPRSAWPDRLASWEERIAVLSGLASEWEAGDHLAYRAVSAGYILGEVVRRATGRDIREVLAGEILDPLGFRWTSYGVAAADVDLVARSYLTGPTTPAHWHIARAFGAPTSDVVDLSNDPVGLTGVVPSGNVVSTADELSRFYEIFRRGGSLDGHRVMSPSTIRLALTPTSGLERDRALLIPLRYGHGPMLGASRRSIFGPDTATAFGHLGFTVNLAWADPRRATSSALLSNGRPLVGPGLLPWLRAISSVTKVCPKVSHSQRPSSARQHGPVAHERIA